VSASWRDRPEAGSAFALRLTVWAALFFGRTLAQPVLMFAAAYFLLTRRAERNASRAFLARVSGRPASLVQVFKHFFNFARVTVDRIYFLAGRADRISVEISGHKVMEDIVANGSGCVLLGSHFGSIEASRSQSLIHDGLRVHLVLDRSVSQKLVEQFEALNPEFGELLIDTGGASASLGLEIAEVLRKGDWVALLGDRYRPGDRTVNCEFLGERARFPAGPFAIAATFKVPVVAVFAACENGRYKLHCELLEERVELPRATREAALQAVVQRYADRLAHHAKSSPYNWFNFYDFWAGIE
jgi:predicted LPLAT superfamily acyltransferase